VQSAAPSAAEPSPQPRVSAVVFAEQYADETCRCADMACADEVRIRYSLELGRATPGADNQRLHDAFVRASGCMQKLANHGSSGN
jgi:hypothetical protein